MAFDPELGGIDGFSDAQIGIMPLHTITEVLGYPGLVRRFELEKASFSPEEQAQLQKAFEWSMDLHAGQTRKREPYGNHILRVAIRIMPHYGVWDVNLITASLLHDTVEDHKFKLTGDPKATDEEALKVIEAAFNADVAGLVRSVTNPEYKEGKGRLEQYQDHIRHILNDHDPRVRILKVSDFTDNATSVVYLPEKDARYRAERYSSLVPIYTEAILRPDTPLSDEAKTHIAEQMEETWKRLGVFITQGAEQEILD